MASLCNSCTFSGAYHKLNLCISHQRDGLDLNPCDACFWDFQEIGLAHFLVLWLLCHNGSV